MTQRPQQGDPSVPGRTHTSLGGPWCLIGFMGGHQGSQGDPKSPEQGPGCPIGGDPGVPGVIFGYLGGTEGPPVSQRLH